MDSLISYKQNGWGFQHHAMTIYLCWATKGYDNSMCWLGNEEESYGMLTSAHNLADRPQCIWSALIGLSELPTLIV